MRLDSPTFLAMSLVAIILLRLSHRTNFKTFAIAGINFCFLYIIFDTWQAASVLGLMLAFVYFLGELLSKSNINLAEIISTTAIVILWGMLFLLKDPTLFSKINPFTNF